MEKTETENIINSELFVTTGYITIHTGDQFNTFKLSEIQGWHWVIERGYEGIFRIITKTDTWKFVDTKGDLAKRFSLVMSGLVPTIDVRVK